MSNLALVKSEMFEDVLCDFWKNENEDIFMTSEQLGKALKYSTPRESVNKLVSRNEYLKDIDFSGKVAMITTDGKLYNTRVFTKQGIVEVCKISSTSNINKINILNQLNIPDKTIKLLLNISTHLIKQNKLYDILRIAFKNTYDIKKQIKIGKYRVDFIINENIIIECDEFGHKDRNEFYEKTRENFLNNLGYKIIRYNPDDNDSYNIFKLINNIIRNINE